MLEHAVGAENRVVGVNYGCGNDVMTTRVAVDCILFAAAELLRGEEIVVEAQPHLVNSDRFQA